MGNIPLDETFGGTYPFRPHYSEAPGFRMHYIDEGTGDPILLLHGFPMWSYLYRNYVPALADSYRVIVPDHMGYGKSEGPEGREYSFAEHSRNLGALVRDLDLRNITLVLHDIGGPIGAGFAYLNHERIKRIVIQNTIFIGMDLARENELLRGPANDTPYLRWMIEQHQAGRFVDLYRNLDVTLVSVIQSLGLVNKTPLSRDAARAYATAFNAPERRHGVNFMTERYYVPQIETLGTEIPDLIVPTPEQVASIREKPAMMVCGLQDRAVNPHVMMDLFHNAFPEGPIITIPDAGHFLQEDAHQQITSLIRLFIALTD